VALEFAMTAGIFLILVMGAIDLGILMWTKNGLQITAAMTARCAALGSCSDPASYATTMANGWVVSGAVTQTYVQYTTSQCYSSLGNYNKFAMVTISSPYWAGLPPPLSNITLQVSACYPVPS
jgi:Flp pilus assembly protein TadG